MPSPRFPAMSTLLDSRVCPLIKFDALFLKITQERRILDGYFLQSFPDETRLLFVVNGLPMEPDASRGDRAASWRSTNSSRPIRNSRRLRCLSWSPTSAYSSA